MDRIFFLFGSLLLLTIIDFNWAIKHHRDRGGHRNEEESLLDKHERERDKKDRKRDDDKKEENRNLTCYKCDGDLCRDPFRTGDSVPLVQCEHSCWKGVFAASVRRSCGNKRCTVTFQGSSALSNTCCQTSFYGNEQQKQSLHSFHRTSTELTSIFISRDECSDIMANMTKTLHMNTPEQTICDVDIVDNHPNKLSNKKQLIEQLQLQLTHNQIQRTQPRDYIRILGQSTTPAQWYKAPSTARSVYFYDPNYQKYVQKSSISPRKTKSNLTSPQTIRIQERSINYSNFIQRNSFSLTPRTKYILDLYKTALNYHQHKQRSNQNYQSTLSHISPQNLSIVSGSQLIPTLPPINTSKEQHDQLSNSFLHNKQQYK
ncbi:unnamed protein product [Rotaria sordida]|uniref:Uncharacterized protein n=1 Tax=Rotaria sordida TaxID=392033 RepID=A0A813UC50_9BILA|nr:unnamed protein product [Rotaria sordida]CAF1432496.1 unnamed protein product [Rotaria sordida]CAF1432642.1 unnamed protein product [Rotaria sordida]